MQVCRLDSQRSSELRNPWVHNSSWTWTKSNNESQCQWVRTESNQESNKNNVWLARLSLYTVCGHMGLDCRGVPWPAVFQWNRKSQPEIEIHFSPGSWPEVFPKFKVGQTYEIGPKTNLVLATKTGPRIVGVKLCKHKLLVVSLPHFDPTTTGQPACRVKRSPAPDFFRFHQNAAEPCMKPRAHRASYRFFCWGEEVCCNVNIIILMLILLMFDVMLILLCQRWPNKFQDFWGGGNSRASFGTTLGLLIIHQQLSNRQKPLEKPSFACSTCTICVKLCILSHDQHVEND